MNKQRLLYLFLTLVVIASGIGVSSKIPINSSLDVLSFESTSERERYNELRENFASDEIMLTVLISSESTVRDFNLFQDLSQLMDRLEEFRSVKQIMFPTRIKFPFKTGPINRSKYLLKIQNEELFNRTFEKLSNYPDVRPKFVSSNNKALGFYIYLKNKSELKAIKQVISNWRNKRETIKAYVLGHSLVENSYKDQLKSDHSKLTLFAFVCMLIGFVLFIRSWKKVLFLLWSVSLSLALFYILVYALGISFNLLSISLPVLILVLALSDAVHIVEMNSPSSTPRSVLKSIGPALWLTTLTTIVSFAVFLFIGSEILTQYASIAIAGLLIAFLVNRFLSLPLLQWIAGTQESKNRPLSIFVPRTKRSAIQRVAVFVIIFLGTVFFTIKQFDLDHYLQAELEPNTEEYLGYGVFKTNFKSERKLDVYFESATNMLTPKFANQLDQLEKYVLHKGCTSTYGLTTLIKRYNRFENGGNPEAYKLDAPTLKNDLDQIITYQKKLGLNAILAKEGKLMKYTIALPDQGAKQAIELENAIRKFITKHFDPSISVWIGGPTSVIEKGILRTMELLIRSLLYAFLAISIVLFFAFRSIWAVSIALIVNAIPVTCVAAYILIVDQFAPGNLMILTIILGVAIDDTIHFLKRFYSENGSLEERLSETINATGRAILRTSLLLCMGFSALLFSNFAFNRLHGLYLILGILIALLADLVLLPALIALKPKQK